MIEFVELMEFIEFIEFVEFIELIGLIESIEFIELDRNSIFKIEMIIIPYTLDPIPCTHNLSFR